MTRTWFLDTNVLANWVMARGGVIDVLHEHANLPQSFVDAYTTRHEHSLAFMDGLMADDGIGDSFYASHLTVNELWKAIKEEATAVLQFQAGTPVAQWRDIRNRPKLSEPLIGAIYDAVMDATVGRLFSDKTIKVVQEASPLDEGYFDAFVPILFRPQFVMTMDATLLTTAMAYEADYFVTRDKSLRKAFNREFPEAGLTCVTPEEAHRILNF